MNEQNKAQEIATDRMQIDMAYQGKSGLQVTSEEQASLSLFGNIKRDPVQLQGKIKDPLLLREALLTLHEIVGSDYSYKPKDRSAYQAYCRTRNESAKQNSWQAQQEYYDWLLRNDPLAFLILDPVVSVHPDQLMFEVFSKDEGSYAALSVNLDALELAEQPSFGTTNIDFSEHLSQTLSQSRSYRTTELSIGQQQVETKVTATDENGEPKLIKEQLEKSISLPDTWLRGFLQVQSAAMLPKESFSLAPIDLYNLLRHLRLNNDIKGKPRGLRVELVPGEPPRLVLEPWELVIESQGGPYQGKQGKILRIWGRRRLMLLKRLLPQIERIDVQVLGSGLPSFWLLHCGAVTLTFALTGFTSSDWSQSAGFDLLLPRQSEQTHELKQVITHLSQCWCDSLSGLASATKLEKPVLLEALQLGCQLGQLIYDVAADLYRLRPLTEQPLELNRLEYRNANERFAHDLLARQSAVTIEHEHRIHGKGIELIGKIVVAEDRCDYRPLLLINNDGYPAKTDCTCSHYRKHKLTAGPCSHLIALRLAYAQEEIRRKNDSSARKNITMETLIFSRRTARGEQLIQITLDQKRLVIRRGKAGETLVPQRLQFNSVEQAREQYFAQLVQLEATGYLNASVG